MDIKNSRDFIPIMIFYPYLPFGFLANDINFIFVVSILHEHLQK